MAFMAVLESDLRALSAEARRRYPAVKDGAEHAILKLRALSGPSEIAHNEDILRIFLMACEAKNVKMSVIGLSSLQKLISHDAVAPSALREILITLKDHAEMTDESVQLKTLQTILIIFQSRLQPEDEENMAQALGISLRLLESNRSSDSVRNTAAATFRQAAALIFDHVVSAESLPMGKPSSGAYPSRSTSVTSDVNRNITLSESMELELVSGMPSLKRETLTKAGKIGLLLLEDLTSLAAGGSAIWLRVSSIQQTFVLDILEFILSNYASVFRILVPYEQVLRIQICSLLMTSLRTNSEPEGEAGEPYFRRLVLRSVAHIIRLYCPSLVTECEVFLSMLVKAISLDLPLWHRILVLEVLRGFCVEARTLRILFQIFDLQPKNSNIVENMVKALARIVASVQFQDTCEESLAAVAGMFSSKAKGIEWSLDNDVSNATVLVASEAHAVTLAMEGLLGVVFTVATLTDEAMDIGELESPRFDSDTSKSSTGETAILCLAMVDSVWLTILDALSLILTKSQGEAIILEILKGYQAFTQACGVLHAVEPLNSFLASLCKFTINIPFEPEKKSVPFTPGSKRSEILVDQRDNIVLTPKNVQALRTLFNVAHRLHNVLGPSWVLVLETLAALDRAINSPHAMTQEASMSAQKLPRESSGQYSDFNILSSLNSQLFESSALMNISAVKALLSALCQLSDKSKLVIQSNFGQISSQKIGNISFSTDRILSIIVNNLHRVEPIWDLVVSHFLELADSSFQYIRNIALEALDRSICSVLGSEQFQDIAASKQHVKIDVSLTDSGSLECAIISPLRVLYCSALNIDVRAGTLKILLHVIERHGDKLYYSWPAILEMLRSVADAPEKDIVSMGFQSLRVIMNDGLSTIPGDCLQVCIDVAAKYSAQKTELNISLTAIGLLWTTTDFVVKGFIYKPEGKDAEGPYAYTPKEMDDGKGNESSIRSTSGITEQTLLVNVIDRDKLMFSVFSLLQKLGTDERPEVRNSSVRTLFQILGSHGQKLSKSMWEDCLWNYVFPTLNRASHMAATSSKDEWQGKELGTRQGKAVHMLIHHSRNTAQKQWDETLVLVLGGIARLLRSFFPFLRSLRNFWSGWESLLHLVENSILSGSKEVALAAINCLQSTVVSHSSKGMLPMDYLKSVIDVYEIVLKKSPSYSGDSATKVEQEILHGLGEVYSQAQRMFDSGMYTQLLAILHMAVRQGKINNSTFEAEFGHIPPLQRTVLEVLPLLYPSDHLSSMWSPFLRELLQYLPRLPQSESNGSEQACIGNFKHDSKKSITAEIPNGSREISLNKTDTRLGPESDTSTVADISSYLFAEKLIPMLVDIYLLAPAAEKYNIFPEFVQGLGRCMTTRRDNPDAALWRVAVEGFNRILVDVSKTKIDGGTDSSKPARISMWKEVADIYDIFLVGYCGRALPSNSLSAAMLKADELLEMKVLDVLGDNILKSQIDAPPDILQRLISSLDRCASRTCSLPLETVELMPTHCSRFSLSCLQKLFSLTRYNEGTEDWNLTRCAVSKVSIAILMTRCEYILRKFLVDESDLGDCSLPAARLEELTYVLEELADLIIHQDTASILNLPPVLKDGIANGKHYSRLHLLVLFPTLCELISSRVSRVRELVQILHKHICMELSLEKLSTSD
ncbi:protein MON2 homolog isoform X2 [Impatiens glandulifera]|uniref:protein MON2 homolog isoform X2 n=1 Tax=Impatiens glandulifera TaxID=253017 RepID=UPI001FB1248C|nr:protein MON2 homolog isoform X2 [Impatiens glandulifera]